MATKPEDNKLEPEGLARRSATEDPKEGDTEGHMFINMDPGTSRNIAKGRSAEIERDMRDRQRQKEARPNRR